MPDGKNKFEMVGFKSSTDFTSDGYGAWVNVGHDVNPLHRAYFHTHPANSAPGLSFADYKVAVGSKIDAYARMTDGARFTFSYQAYLGAGSPSVEYVYYNQGEFSR